MVTEYMACCWIHCLSYNPSRSLLSLQRRWMNTTRERKKKKSGLEEKSAKLSLMKPVDVPGFTFCLIILIQGLNMFRLNVDLECKNAPNVTLFLQLKMFQWGYGCIKNISGHYYFNATVILFFKVEYSEACAASSELQCLIILCVRADVSQKTSHPSWLGSWFKKNKKKTVCFESNLYFFYFAYAPLVITVLWHKPCMGIIQF